jgi:Ethylene insensitive 3
MDRNESILLSGQSSTGQRNISTTSEADSSPVEPSILHLKEILSLSDTNDSEVNSTDSSSYQSSSSEEARMEKYKRKLFMYRAMLDEKQAEHNPESTKMKKPKNSPSDIYSHQMLQHNSIKIIENSFQRAMDEANMQGYAYGIILKDGSVISRSSPSLCRWWAETVRFQQNGPAAIDRYYVANELFDPNKDTDTPRRTYNKLMALSDATLGSLLSTLMNRCNPPQRKFPLDMKVPPPWWPTGDELWWDQITIEKDQGPPPYKKPHDLRKMWKAAVVIAIIKHMAPAFDKLAHMVRQSKNLQGRMSVREMQAWNYVLKEEVKIYSREHPDVPLSNFLGSFPTHVSVLSNSSKSSCSHDEAEGFQSQHIQQPMVPQKQVPSLTPSQQQQQQQHVSSMLNFPTERRMMRYTCDHPRCLHNDKKFGFPSEELRDQHLNFCGFRNSMGQFGTPFELPAFPIRTMYQDTMSPQFTQLPQARSTPFQQIAPPPFQPQMVPQSPTAAYEDITAAFSEMGPLQQESSFDSSGIPDYYYPEILNESQDIGSLQSAFFGNGFFNGEGRGDNIGLFI